MRSCFSGAKPNHPAHFASGGRVSRWRLFSFRPLIGHLEFAGCQFATARLHQHNATLGHRQLRPGPSGVEHPFPAAGAQPGRVFAAREAAAQRGAARTARRHRPQPRQPLVRRNSDGRLARRRFSHGKFQGATPGFAGAAAQISTGSESPRQKPAG